MAFKIFDGLKAYATRWQLKETIKFEGEEKASIKEAKVVASKWGNSCCFTTYGGEQYYIPMSKDATAVAGEILDVDKIDVQILEKEGHLDIKRIMI